jgi:hypothetical protein
LSSHFNNFLNFQVKPGSYEKKGETEGGAMEMFDDYSLIAKDEIEWFSSKRGYTHPYGLLVRVVTASNLEELNEYFELSEDSKFRQTSEFSLEKGQ